jgi:predicted small secreted protein
MNPQGKKTDMRTFVTLMMLALATVAVSACNTVKGVGKDVERLGQKMQN